MDPAPQVIFETVRLTPKKKRKVRFQITYFTKLNFSLKLDTSIEFSAMYLKWDISRYLPEVLTFAQENSIPDPTSSAKDKRESGKFQASKQEGFRWCI